MGYTKGQHRCESTSPKYTYCADRCDNDIFVNDENDF